MTEFIILNLILTALSVLWGKIIFILVKSRLFHAFVSQAMNHSAMTRTELENSSLGMVYYLFSFLATLVICIVRRYPLWQWFALKREDAGMIVIAILTWLSFLSLISGIAGLVSPKTDWASQIGKMSWIVSLNKRRKGLKAAALIAGAFFEELFFRGVCFGMLYRQFPDVSPIYLAVFSGCLFGVEQALFSNDRKNGILFFTSGLFMGIIAACLMMYTESILPSLIAHESFLIFYFANFAFFDKKAARRRY